MAKRPAGAPSQPALRTTGRRQSPARCIISPHRGRATAAALLATTALVPITASANPQGGVVVGGNATISQPAPNQVTITQQSNRAIINWQGFSIGQRDATTFQQPSPSSVALNRVVGGNPSMIAGHLSANGVVYLVNPNGVVFTPTAQVDVNGLIATTHDIANAAFMAGKDTFNRPGKPGSSVVNQGTITARDRGLVGLVAPSVRNDGVIQAHLGKVALASGNAFAVDLYGDQLIQFAVPITAVQSQSAGAAVVNTGRISANGGTVWLGANTAKRIVDQAINTTGVIQATAVHQQGGQIILDGGDGGAVRVAGTLDASGQGTGQTGGTVKVLGNRVALSSGATINVSGNAGGGTALIGGNFHGAGPERSARITTVAAGATIKADAVGRGNGGKVAVWSNDTTNFDGVIYARGGDLTGNGGFVETSGKQNLSVQSGSVKTTAPHGSVGDWLMDPASIIVAPGGVASLQSVTSFGINPGTRQTISPNTIDAASSNVVLQATQDISFAAPISMVNNGIGITAQAGRNVVVNPGASITTRGGLIQLSANDPSAPAPLNGSLDIFAPLRTDGGSTLGGTVFLRVTGGTGGLFLSPTTGNITTHGGSILLAAPPNGIRMGGIDPFTNTLLTLDTTSGGAFASGAPISFETGIFGSYFARQRLFLAAGGNDISFSGNVAVGGLTIYSARNVTASGFITANSFFTDLNQTGNLIAPGGISASGGVSAAIPGNENAGSINIATQGNIRIGTDNNTSGINVAGLLIAAGGSQQGTGNGGNGADVTVHAGGTVTLAGVNSDGGIPHNGSTHGGNAGNISITANTISLLDYPSETFSGIPNLTHIEVNAAGGPNSDTTAFLPETITGVGGNITLDGHIVLRGGAGKSVLVDNLSNGSNTNISINGNIDATTPGAESLILVDGHGQLSVGNIGAAIPLNSVSIEDNVTGSIGSVTANSLTRFYSSLLPNLGATTTTFNGPVNISGDASLKGSHLHFADDLRIGGSATFASADLTAKSVSVGGPTTISADTTISTTATKGPMTFSSIDGAQSFSQSLALDTGTGAISHGTIGSSVPLKACTINGASCFPSPITTAPPSQTDILLNQYQAQSTANVSKGIVQPTPLQDITVPALQSIVATAFGPLENLLPVDLATQFQSELNDAILTTFGNKTISLTDTNWTLFGFVLSGIADKYINDFIDQYSLTHNAAQIGTLKYTLQVTANSSIDYATTPELWAAGWVGLGGAVGAGIIQSTISNVWDLGVFLATPTPVY